MPKWTESDISTFWEMKREGATLLEIAERLGRNYTAVATFSSKQTKKHKPKEDKPMTNETMPEANTAPAAVPDIAPKLPKLDVAVSAALAMITAQGFVLGNFSVSMDGESASISICFLRGE